MTTSRSPRGPEWPTLALVLATYAAWCGGVALSSTITPWAAVPILALALTLHSSLQHEVAHGHPLPSRRLSEALVWPPIGLLVPYPRFRDTHLAHHQDAILTDPYDDPESNYLDPEVWAGLPGWARRLLLFNNTLLGRMTVGPAVGMAAFLRSDWRAIRAGDRALARVWAAHLAGVAVVLGIVLAFGTIPLGAYLVAAWLAMSILKIRTFLEHQAHERARGRSVIIEDHGPLAFLFLNNNLHAVHHAHPQVPWYALPQLYAARREEWLRRNLGYRYDSYAQILRRHLLRRKDPVPHPLWPQG
ncbi:fatty acid desaturase [Amaricoccus sp.]|uniref:fatty acid desaturase n=1 Tax=Amaricoccus sp. TaxID=1872485 RepID=UPI001B5057A6|nr:fatty acid desaturase [Amaricoccus sp.]MBP7003609.1 fatty acid desaturase [Amaricoccus sp.]